MSDEHIETNTESNIEEKREKIVNTIKKLKDKKNLITYLILAAIIYLGIYIRTRNIPLLKDITTGKAIPMALDPHVFLRYAEYILEHGKLMAIDTFRFVPFGKSTTSLEQIIPYTIVYFYKFLSIFFPSITIQTVDIIYPVIFYMLAAIMFFLLIKRLFDVKIALLSTLILSVIPSFLYRTMAGFSEKEPMGIFFTFAALYFFVAAWQTKKFKKSLALGLLSGISTGLLGLSWGGVKFVLITISVFSLIILFLNKFKKRDFYLYLAWIIPWVFMMTQLTTKFGTLKSLTKSFSSGIAFLVLLIALIDFLVFKLDLLKLKDKLKDKLPQGITNLIGATIIAFIGSTIIFGPSFLFQQISNIFNTLIHPLGINRWLLTVAENRQPFFTEWIGTFGKFYLYLFLIGSILLFYNMIKKLKHTYKLTALYVLFLTGFILSRYSSSSPTWNGTSKIAVFAYIGSLLAFILIISIIYLYNFYKNKELFNEIRNIDKRYIFILVWFLLMTVSARGALRLFFVFAPITTVMVSYLMMELYKISSKFKDKAFRILGFIIIILILFNPIGNAYDGIVTDFARNSINQAKNTGPSYNQQWQVAMAWVRENTPEDSVFAHWWDYGYWVQTGGKRATVLDGGNTFVNWNHLMGRHVLTAHSEDEALEFLKTHKATHFLIDPTDVGKYPAYSSIGADENFDRYSWIGVYEIDNSKTQELRDKTNFIYTGGVALDHDYIYEGELYAGGSGVAGFILSTTMNENGEINNIDQPTMIIFARGQQNNIPIECMMTNNQEIHFGNGYPGCLVLIPSVRGDRQNNIGGALFISEEGMKALWVQLYLLNRPFPNFKEVYNDQAQMPLLLYNGRQIGPIRIWELNYPSHIKEKEEYLGGDLPEWF